MCYQLIPLIGAQAVLSYFLLNFPPGALPVGAVALEINTVPVTVISGGGRSLALAMNVGIRLLIPRLSR